MKNKAIKIIDENAREYVSIFGIQDIYIHIYNHTYSYFIYMGREKENIFIFLESRIISQAKHKVQPLKKRFTVLTTQKLKTS